jgi:hypothetical protein
MTDSVMLAIAFVFVRMISRSRMLVLALEMMGGVKYDQIECLTGCKSGCCANY